MLLQEFAVNGKEVATPVDGERAPGIHVVLFAPREIITGFHFHKLTAGQFS